MWSWCSTNRHVKSPFLLGLAISDFGRLHAGHFHDAGVYAHSMSMSTPVHPNFFTKTFVCGDITPSSTLLRISMDRSSASSSGEMVLDHSISQLLQSGSPSNFSLCIAIALLLSLAFSCGFSTFADSAGRAAMGARPKFQHG
jgi:hypothetical protein